ncbi:MAG: CaiB/BaiF CoA transferase family protein [Gaiellales bacterium]
MPKHDSGAALQGMRVLDLSNLYAGPMVSTILGDFGADVVKVEHPRGDDARRWGLSKDGVSLWWKVLSRNKRLLRLDLNRPEDRDLVLELAVQADLVIENFRPGRLEHWGLGFEALSNLNERLIMLRVTGYGQSGPRSHEPGFGTLAEAFSGFAYITGEPDGPPTLPPFGLADGVAALTGAYGVMMAMYWRDAIGSGKGQWIDLTLYEPLFNILGPQVTEYTQTGTVQERQGNRSPRTAPRNTYVTVDGHWIATSAGTQSIADRIFAAVGHPELADDERFSSASARRAHADDIDAVLADAIAGMKLATVLRRFREEAAPIAPVQSVAQISQDEHFLARHSIITVDDEDLGEVTMQAPVPRLSRTPATVRFTGRNTIGADSEQVRETLWGISVPTVPSHRSRGTT